jgi:hypothetical protein
MLYLVKSYNAIKIGSTNNIKIRMHDYKTHNPDFELLDIADGGLEEEKKLQQKLEKYSYKHSKEWFKDCLEIREVWNNYVKLYSKKYSKYEIEKVKPHDISIDEYTINEYGEHLLYDEPLYNLITKEYYKNIQDLINSEHIQLSNLSFLFTHISTMPYRFINASEIECTFGYSKPYPTMDKVYETFPFDYKAYYNKINNIKERPLFNKEKSEKKLNKCPEWILSKLEKDKQYQYEELEKLFTPLFEEHGLIWNKNTSMKLYFPDFIKKIRTINKVKYKFYTFNIF